MRKSSLPVWAAVSILCAGAVQTFGGDAKSGQGKMSAAPSVVAAASSNNFAFTFRAPNSGDYHPGSQATLQVPAGWPAPQTNNASAAGLLSVTPVLSQTTVSIGSITGSGPWTITFDFATSQKGSGFIVNYANVLAPTSAGIHAFPAQTKQNGAAWSRIKTGSPTVTVNNTNKPTTTTAVTASVNPSVYGQLVTFTATVTPQGTGTLSGTITFLDGDVVLGSNALNAAGQAVFSTSTLSVADSPHSIFAQYSGNATFNSSISAELIQDVTPASLTVSGITANNKVYDGTTAASLNTGSTVLSGAVAGDDVTLDASGAAGSFADNQVGAAKPVTVSGLALGGVDSANYMLLDAAGITADITTLTVSPGITVQDKAYDGGTLATIATRTLSGSVGGDDVSLVGGTADFCDAYVGNDKDVTATGLVLGGAAAGNYTLASTSATTTASIMAVQAPTLSITLNPDGSAHLNCSGAPGTVFRFLAASELTGPWSVISTNTVGTNGVVSFVDADAPGFPTRFYRTMISY